jgi:hypothetical protein
MTTEATESTENDNGNDMKHYDHDEHYVTTYQRCRSLCS